MNHKLPYNMYCMTSYLFICYYSLSLIFNTNVTPSHYFNTNDSNYYKLTVASCQYFIIDTIYKIVDYFYLQISKTNPIMKFLMLYHHIGGLIGTITIYKSGFGASSIIYLYLFELSSIPLLLFSNNYKRHITLPCTWLAFLLVRIIFGNYILLQLIYHLFIENISLFLKIGGLNAYIFFITVNNLWFYKLSQMMLKSC